MSNNVDQIEESPLSDDDIKKYFPDAKILSYDKLKNYKTIKKLLPKKIDYCFILYQQQKNVGHWIALIRYGDNIEYYDSYGNRIDEPLTWNDEITNVELGQDKPYLTNLLKNSKFNITHNTNKYQKSNSKIATCGRHCALRILALLKGYNLDDYHKLLLNSSKTKKINYDRIVSDLINII